MVEADAAQRLEYSEESRYFTRARGLWQADKWLWDDDFLQGILVPAMKIRPGSRLLDVGCGIAGLPRRIYSALMPGGAVNGIDIGSDAVEEANAFDRARGFENIELACGDARNLTDFYEDDSFDAVIEVGVLCSLREPAEVREVLRQMVQVCKPGGTVCSWELDFPLFILAEQGLIGRLLRTWTESFADGALQLGNGDRRIGSKTFGYLGEQGLGDLRVKAYLAPEPLPPYTPEVLEVAEEFGRWFKPHTEEHNWVSTFLTAGGMSRPEIIETARELDAWWQTRMELMQANTLPPLFSQLFVVAFGRKPEASTGLSAACGRA